MYLKPYLKQPINAKQSQSFGRYLYKLQIEDQCYWLKMHIQAINHISEHAFLNELLIYQELDRKKQAIDFKHASLLLPFHIIQTRDLCDSAIQALPNALLIQDSKGLFEPKAGQLSQSELLNILLKSLDVIDSLHQIGYLHGDLKVEHFRILFENQSSYLIDFEQSSSLDSLHMLQTTATPRYMAPELFHAAPKTTQTDIYALGIIWLEWLTQKRIPQKTYIEWAYLHCQQLQVVLPTAFQSLQLILETMLAKNNQQRFENIYQIKQRLSQFV